LSDNIECNEFFSLPFLFLLFGFQLRSCLFKFRFVFLPPPAHRTSLIRLSLVKLLNVLIEQLEKFPGMMSWKNITDNRP
jgi:hypothetical protein